MPQAIQELRDEWGISDFHAIVYLESKGFTVKGGTIKAPNPEAWNDAQAQRATLYLVQEWDYDHEQLPHV